MKKLIFLFLVTTSIVSNAAEDKCEELLTVDLDSTQSIEQNFPEIIETSYAKDSLKIGADKKAKTITTTKMNYTKLVPHLVKLIQSQQKQIDSLTNQLAIKSNHEKVRGKTN
jgi:hypothetical protein